MRGGGGGEGSERLLSETAMHWWLSRRQVSTRLAAMRKNVGPNAARGFLIPGLADRKVLALHPATSTRKAHAGNMRMGRRQQMNRR